VRGTSFRRKAIASLAQNPAGKTALVAFAAELRLERGNPHDINAVAVWYEEEKLGYLSQEQAPHYKRLANQLPDSIEITTAIAMITCGLVTEDRVYEYRIEVDIPEDGRVLIFPERAQFPVARYSGYALPKRAATGKYVADVWLPTAEFLKGGYQKELSAWTADSWKTVGFFLVNQSGLSTQEKVYEIPKTRFYRMFRDLDEVSAVITDTGKRFAKLTLTRIP
jgi:hypothetical protein